jgi:hypothetical protein
MTYTKDSRNQLGLRLAMNARKQGFCVECSATRDASRIPPTLVQASRLCIGVKREQTFSKLLDR